MHGPDLVFGPALVTAYEIESRIAQSARVVIDARAADRLRTVGDPYATGFAPSDLMTTDDDGRQILDFLGPTALESAGLGSVETLVNHVRSLIVSRLDTGESATESRGKMKSLARYFNRAAAGHHGAMAIPGV
jgi:hypothetical protein